MTELTRPEIPFTEFPKIARWSRDVVVTEKIDGTNAQVLVSDDGLRCYAGSRTRWILPSDDNFGFARWVQEHAEELLKLGPGSHFGEWWGSGIQRGYGLKEKRFSLFNVSHWADEDKRPACCGVVPTIWRGPMDELDLAGIMRRLQETGSHAAPGFTQPEGVVVFHTAGGYMFKKTFLKDAAGKERGA